MQQPAKNSLSILGIIIAMVSLWLSWITFHQVPRAVHRIAFDSNRIGNANDSQHTSNAKNDGSERWIVILNGSRP